MDKLVIWLQEAGMKDVELVGGKNASLGEMISNLAKLGVKVPGGFATTAEAYRRFLSHDNLNNKINQALKELDVDNLKQLTETGAQIRKWIIENPFPVDLEAEVKVAYEEMTKNNPNLKVAVRSSATAEDLPDASFAGQQETFLNIHGFAAVKQAIHEVFASLFTDRAISYRERNGYAHENVALSAGIQTMVRSETGSSGVMFTLDTESGFDQAVFVTSSYGLGEALVQGTINPDEFYVYKPSVREGKPAILRRTLGTKKEKMIYGKVAEAGKSVETVEVSLEDRNRFSITDTEATELAKQALIIEEHYKCPMDMEWAKDGDTGELFIVQARPETVQSQKKKSGQKIESFVLKETGEVLAEGRSIGQKIGSGKVRIVSSPEDMHKVEQGDILVTDMTDPDWEPAMKKSAAIVTNRGGRTCHAAIIARELGVPAVVGCGNATMVLTEGQEVTVSCAEGDTGFVYAGKLEFSTEGRNIETMPNIPFKIMMNVGNPDKAFAHSVLPNSGIGLARLEFIINRMIGVHPKALLEFDKQSQQLKDEISQKIAGYKSPVDFYVEKLIEGISTLAASVAPEKVIVRMSDFKTNEYRGLIGGEAYEAIEENPMLGFRGASRYISESFRECFEMECKALKFVRDEMGLTNVEIMIPFVRTLGEAEQVVKLLSDNGLERGKNGLRLIMMCELPSNAVLAEEFLRYFDGFSIGSNDLTQLTLGLDRDSGVIAHLFDERDPAVKKMLSMAIAACNKENKYIGICGQGPSDHPDLALWLMQQGITSVSLNPDAVLSTWFDLAKETGEK